MDISKIRIDKKFAKKLPNPKPQFMENLKADIAHRGILTPFLITRDGLLLDGHRRMAVARDLGITDVPVHVVPVGGDRGWEYAAFVAAKINREELSQFVRADLGTSLLRVERKAAKERQGNRSGQHVGPKSPHVEKDRATERVARQFGMGRKSFETVLRVKTEAPEIHRDALAGKIKTVAAAKNALLRKEREEAAAAAPPIRLPKGYSVIHGDFREKAGQIPDGSVPLIFTDPPYLTKDIPLYGDLGKFAAEKLVDGGSLLCYVGHHALLNAGDLLREHLKLWWVICVRQRGATARMHAKRVFVGWKPILWFVKGTRREAEFVHDTVTTPPGEKQYHKWAQSVDDATYYIERLTAKGELVVDPFVGSGTTGIAAVKSDRKFWGCEIDEVHYKTAKARVWEAAKGS